MPVVIGLTGGIGSGKTTVADLFAAKGAAIVDTDEISHGLTRPGQPAVREIARRLGERFVTPDGALDRPGLREFVFADVEARKTLESILHPLIRRESSRLIDESRAPYTILVVPLLVETGAYRERISRIVVIDCEPETQIRRVMQRSGLSRDTVLAIIGAQASRRQRLELADDVIDNDDGIESLQPQVERLHLRFVALAQKD